MANEQGLVERLLKNAKPEPKIDTTLFVSEQRQSELVFGASLPYCGKDDIARAIREAIEETVRTVQRHGTKQIETQAAELAELRAEVERMTTARDHKRFVGLMVGQDPDEVWKSQAFKLAEELDAAEAARDRARNDALEEAAKVLEEGYDRVPGKPYRSDDVPSKNDQCAHGNYGWEECEQCAVIAIRALKEQGNG